MRVVRTIAQLRAVLAGAERPVGFVPTMGALHEGHLSLLRTARSGNSTVVLSIFVNPTQFTEAGDLDAYPRDEPRDRELAAAAGVDVVFAPEPGELYPDGFATTVGVSGRVAESLEGAARGRAHFDGVATVVVKLLLAVAPDTAYFGAKDAQQAIVVRRVVADLGLPVRIELCPTSRDPDGVARSSRNARLAPEDRRRAAAIPRALGTVRDAVAGGETGSAALLALGRSALAAEGIEVEYLAIVDPETLDVVDEVDRPVLVALAVRVGGVRLIDNIGIAPPVPPSPRGE